jgi:hypothetical protein
MQWHLIMSGNGFCRSAGRCSRSEEKPGEWNDQHVLYKLNYFRESSIFWGITLCESQLMFQRNMLPPSSGSKNKPSKKPACSKHSRALLDVCFMLVSCLAYSLILKMEATCSSETSVGFQWITWCCSQECRTHSHCFENSNPIICSVQSCHYAMTVRWADTSAISGQWLGKHISAATDMNTTEQLCFLCGPCQDIISKGKG